MSKGRVLIDKAPREHVSRRELQVVGFSSTHATMFLTPCSLASVYVPTLRCLIAACVDGSSTMRLSFQDL